ncbi:MAG TPA: PD-(D/E)XK nuclease family transposase [Candidatus Onthocola stercorigallinarum]|nr:PD-(D/E)XK nuclease family transposase [Candidatus Onthocola stercorigallinarum]
MKVNEKEFVKGSDDQMFKIIVEDPIHGKRILEALISQILREPVEIVEFINNELTAKQVGERKKTVDIIVKTKNSYINVEVNLNDYTDAKRSRNFIFFSSFYSHLTKKGEDYDTVSEYIQINLNYGATYDLNTNSGIRKYHIQTDDLEMLIPNVAIIEVNVENLKKECYNGVRCEYDYRYIFMFDMDKEELEQYYPNDEIKEEFFKLITLKNEDFWIDPDEDKEKLLNTERNINFSKGLKQGIEQGLDEKTYNVIKNLLSVNSPIETIAIAVGLSTDEVKNIIEEHKLDKTSE